MKKLFTLVFFLSIIPFVNSQSILSYSFNNSLAESNGAGPVLSVLGNPGIYVLDTLNEINGKTKTVYRFETNSGFQLDNVQAGHFLDSTYSIELYFKFDFLNSWKRVVDWKNRKSDHGAYVYNGQLNFYPYVYSSGDTVPVRAGEYTYYIITRNGITKELKIYTDARVEIAFTDSYDDGILDADQVLNFFHDDLAVPNEASSGAVALLNIYNYVLDSASIVHKWNNINGQIYGIGEPESQFGRFVYPNPATDKISIDLRPFPEKTMMEISMVNSTGMVVYSEKYASGYNWPVDLQSLNLATGIYLIRAQSAKKSVSQKLIIR